jgi:hypothetical protein
LNTWNAVVSAIFPKLNIGEILGGRADREQLSIEGKLPYFPTVFVLR